MSAKRKSGPFDNMTPMMIEELVKERNALREVLRAFVGGSCRDRLDMLVKHRDVCERACS